MVDFKDKKILITGGTGSFGIAYTRYLLGLPNKPDEIRVFSRDEQKHYALLKEFPEESSGVKFFLGDVRNQDRLDEVVCGVDYVVHSAAMKHLPMAELNPMEAIRTNILGTHNLVQSCMRHNVAKVVALSTDKAALSISAYGATKFLLEKLMIAANKSPKNQGTSFSIVRYANIFGSKGSVVPLFLKIRDQGKLPITATEMTRFSLDMDEGIALVNYAFELPLAGAIVVPKAPSYSVGDVARAVCPDCELEIIGPRNSEKMHEILITEEESMRTLEDELYYVIRPEYSGPLDATLIGGLRPVTEKFTYSSGNNHDWLSVDAIKQKIEQIF